VVVGAAISARREDCPCVISSGREKGGIGTGRAFGRIKATGLSFVSALRFSSFEVQRKRRGAMPRRFSHNGERKKGKLVAVSRKKTDS